MSFSSTNASCKCWHHHSPTASSITCISQGSVATVLSRGAKTRGICVEFLPDVAWQKLLKLAGVSRSYSKNKSGTFLWTTVYINRNVPTWARLCTSWILRAVKCLTSHPTDSVKTEKNSTEYDYHAEHTTRNKMILAAKYAKVFHIQSTNRRHS